jgi:hypothetical protein
MHDFQGKEWEGSNDMGVEDIFSFFSASSDVSL